MDYGAWIAVFALFIQSIINIFFYTYSVKVKSEYDEIEILAADVIADLEVSLSVIKTMQGNSVVMLSTLHHMGADIERLKLDEIPAEYLTIIESNSNDVF